MRAIDARVSLFRGTAKLGGRANRGALLGGVYVDGKASFQRWDGVSALVEAAAAAAAAGTLSRAAVLQMGGGSRDEQISRESFLNGVESLFGLK